MIEAEVIGYWDSRAVIFTATAETYKEALELAYNDFCKYADDVAKNENGWVMLDEFSSKKLEEFGIKE